MVKKRENTTEERKQDIREKTRQKRENRTEERK